MGTAAGTAAGTVVRAGPGTVAVTAVGTAGGTAVSTAVSTAARTAASPEDAALAVAVERVRELSLRLWAVRAAHSPLRTRLRGTRCGGCGQAFPCATVRAAAGGPSGR